MRSKDACASFLLSPNSIEPEVIRAFTVVFLLTFALMPNRARLVNLSLES